MANTIPDFPTFATQFTDWERYRFTYQGGREFVERYLYKYDVGEEDADFLDRKSMTYCPAFASSAVDEINNAVFSRMPDVVRKSDSISYMSAIRGELHGVDYNGSTIDNFIGCELLPELTVMGRVGVYVDMPADVPATKDARAGQVHPYYYIYRAEDIIGWEPGLPGSGHEFVKLLLRDHFYKYDEEYHLVSDIDSRYRLLEVIDGGQVKVTFYTNERIIEFEKVLNLPRIPFVMFSLKHSLLRNICDYQIALMNIESTDIQFARKANFPLYVEQVNWIQSLPNNLPEEQIDEDGEFDGTIAPSSDAKVELGMKHGRRYAKQLNAPEYIHPSPEPLRIAMEKEDQIKRDMRILIHLNVSSLGNKSVSFESKAYDRQGLENGLSKIALTLEEGERKLLYHWQEYTNTRSEIVVSYPRQFDLRTDEDRRAEASELNKLSDTITSQTFKREIKKEIVHTIFGNKVSKTLLEKMYNEIEQAPSVTSDPKIIHMDHEAGLVSDQTAAELRGYKKDEVVQAQKDKIKRMAETVKAQGGAVGAARGTPDFEDGNDGSVPDSSQEKQGKAKRGEAKL